MHKNNKAKTENYTTRTTLRKHKDMNDWKYIVDLMGKLESKSPKSASSWMNSPFLYIRLLAIRQKGKEGEKIVKTSCKIKGAKLVRQGLPSLTF